MRNKTCFYFRFFGILCDGSKTVNRSYYCFVEGIIQCEENLSLGENLPKHNLVILIIGLETVRRMLSEPEAIDRK